MRNFLFLTIVFNLSLFLMVMEFFPLLAYSLKQNLFPVMFEKNCTFWDKFPMKIIREVNYAYYFNDGSSKILGEIP